MMVLQNLLPLSCDDRLARTALDINVQHVGVLIANALNQKLLFFLLNGDTFMTALLALQPP